VILRKYGKHLGSKLRLVIGQIALLLGISGAMIMFQFGKMLPAFIRGICIGFCAALFGISLVFNLSTLPLVKEKFGLDSTQNSR